MTDRVFGQLVTVAQSETTHSFCVFRFVFPVTVTIGHADIAIESVVACGNRACMCVATISFGHRQRRKISAQTKGKPVRAAQDARNYDLTPRELLPRKKYRTATNNNKRRLCKQITFPRGGGGRFARPYVCLFSEMAVIIYLMIIYANRKSEDYVQLGFRRNTVFLSFTTIKGTCPSPNRQEAKVARRKRTACRRCHARDVAASARASERDARNQ